MLKSAFILATALATSLSFTPAVQAQTDDPFREESALGTTDWSQGSIEATGQGTARYMSSKVREELMAKQAARTMAQARLLEMVRGVRVTGLTTLDAHARSDTRAATRIRGTLKGAQLVNETVTWVKDSESRRGESVMAEVTLKLCIAAPCTTTTGGSLTTATFGAETPATKTSNTAPTAASAVILDLNQALYLPSLAPQIRTTSGDILYSQDSVDPAIITEKGLIHYTQSVTEAQSIVGPDARATVITVASISDDNHIILDDQASATLKDHPALKSGQVYVALD